MAMEIESMVLSEEEQARILSDDVPKEGRGPANDAIILLPNALEHGLHGFRPASHEPS